MLLRHDMKVEGVVVKDDDDANLRLYKTPLILLKKEHKIRLKTDVCNLGSGTHPVCESN